MAIQLIIHNKQTTRYFTDKHLVIVTCYRMSIYSFANVINIVLMLLLNINIGNENCLLKNKLSFIYVEDI